MTIRNGTASLDKLFSAVRARYLGLGVLLAWVYCTWFSNAVFPPADALQTANVRAQTLAVSLVASAVGLFAMAFRPNKRQPLGERILVASACAVSLSTLFMMFLAQSNSIVPQVLAAIGGLSSSVLWIAWGELFCQIDDEMAESCIPASLIAFAVAAAIACALPAMVGGPATACLPAASCVMLLLCKRQQPDSYAFPQSSELFENVLPSLVKLALCSMVCSIATGYVSFAAHNAGVLAPMDNTIYAYIAGAVIAGILSAFAIAHTRRINFSFLYEWAIPIIVIALALSALDGRTPQTIALVLACTATLYVEVLFYTIFVKVTAQGFCLPSESFGLFRAIVQLGFLVSGILAAWVAIEGRYDLEAVLTLICSCVIMLPLFIHLQARLDPTWSECVGIASQAAIPTAIAPLPPAKNKDAVAPIDTTVRAVDAVAEEYKLSPRETEILHYLAKGRSAPYMRDCMYISKSTIETHIKHIYAKTGVHYKQELIDLIERTTS